MLPVSLISGIGPSSSWLAVDDLHAFGRHCLLRQPCSPTSHHKSESEPSQFEGAAPPEEAARERGVRAELLVNSPNPEQLARIAELVAGGDVHVEIAEAMPLADARRAHELSEGGHVRGKLVLTLAA
jgi:hypothetical protein